MENNVNNKNKRQLKDLVSVGSATILDFKLLGIQIVDDLRKHEARELYERLCFITKARHDPCVEDVFRAAIEQANNPNLEPEKKNWWYWSRIRKGLIKDDKK